MNNVPILVLLNHEEHDFLMEVYMFMRYMTFAPDSTIVKHGEPATRLIVVTDGECEVFVEPSLHDEVSVSLARASVSMSAFDSRFVHMLREVQQVKTPDSQSSITRMEMCATWALKKTPCITIWT